MTTISTYTITIREDSSGVLQSCCAHKTIGRVDDNHSVRLVLERPEAFLQHALALAFSCNGQQTQVSLGAGNTYLLPRTLTQFEKLDVMPIFHSDDAYKKSGSVLTFRFDSALPGGGTPPPPWPDFWHETASKAWWGQPVAQDSYLSVLNSAGDEITQIPTGGGGSGGTSNYNALSNKPQVNGVTLSGDKTAQELGLVAAQAGMGLSSNDYTGTEKSKVSHLHTAAQLPTGGATGQVLSKAGPADYATQWANAGSAALPQASGTTLGGVKADAAESDDTQPVRIDTQTGKLFTAPGGASPFTRRQGLMFIGDSITMTGSNITAIASDDTGTVTVTTGASASVGKIVGLFFIAPKEFNGYFVIDSVGSGSFTVKNSAVAPNTSGSVLPGFTIMQLQDPPSSMDYRYYSYAGYYGMERIPAKYVIGYGGSNIQMWLNNLEALVYQQNPEYVHILLGANNMTTAVSSATSAITLYTQLLDALQSRGYKLIVGLIPPRTAASYVPAITRFNAWLKQEAIARGIPYVDYYAAIADQTTGAAATGMLYDTTHPSPLGHAHMGRALVKAMSDNHLFTQDILLPTSAGQNQANRSNLLNDPLLTQAPKTVGTANVSGEVGSEFSVNAGARMTVTASLEPRDDGFGNSQVLECTVSDAGTATLTVTVYQPSISLTVEQDSVLYGIAAYRVDLPEGGAAGDLFTHQQVQFSCKANGTTVSSNMLYNITGNSRPYVVNGDTVMKSPKKLIPGGSVFSGNPMMTFTLTCNAGARFTMKIGRVGILLAPAEAFVL